MGVIEFNMLRTSVWDIERVFPFSSDIGKSGAVEVELDWVVLVAGLTTKSGDDWRRPSLNELRREFIPSGYAVCYRRV